MMEEEKDEKDEMENELPPVDKTIDVVKYHTIRKGKRWWSAVALVKSFGRNQIAFYLWQKKEGKWARKQKFVVHNRTQWDSISVNVEEFLSELK